MNVDALAHAIIREAAEPDPLYLSRPFHHGFTRVAARWHQRDIPLLNGRQSLPPVVARPSVATAAPVLHVHISRSAPCCAAAA
ncbi:MAG TPA: hypothetical protein VMM78_13725 [Thermomicrobiales bacterium]|nr:hypothetical protein [Thermomicrobiales bacterium]